MKTIVNELYHVYNQGNNREQLFYSDADYLSFLSLYRRWVFPHCDTLAYCLMPNHFHFLLYANEQSVNEITLGNVTVQSITNGFRLLQSSYAKQLNPRHIRSGSLFRQRTKYKPLANGKGSYGLTVFHYIHENPVAGGLVGHRAEWPYSSWPDYIGLRHGTLCNQQLAAQLLDFGERAFYHSV